MSVQADAETLRQIPIFADCQPLHLQLLAFASERQKFSAGQNIITQDQGAGAAYLILNGRVKLTQTIGEATSTLAIAEPGTLLGEVAMIGQTAYAITAQALDAVTTARIDHKLFVRVATEYPEFGRTVLAALSRNLQNSIQDFGRVRSSFTKGRLFSEI